MKIWPSEVPDTCPIPPSDAFAALGFTGGFVNHSNADTWYPSWAADGRLYSPFTDGTVDRVLPDGTTEPLAAWSFGAEAAVGHAIIEGEDVLHLSMGHPQLIAAAPAPYEGRYPCACLHHNGVWYIGTYALARAAYGLNWPILGPFAGFHVSLDNGATWEKSPWGCQPGKTLFPEPAQFRGPLKLGVPHVVDFGRNMEHSPDGKMYLVGHGATQQDEADRRANLSWITGDQIYLCRVTPTPATVNDPDAYEFFAGYDPAGEPVWSRNHAHLRPLIDWLHHCGGVTITYNSPLKKYLMCVTDGRTTMSPYDTYILEADRITGPWKMVSYMKDFGPQAYFVNIPGKFISADGRSFWLCYSANWMNVCYQSLIYPANPPGSFYRMSLHEVRLLTAGEAGPLPLLRTGISSSPREDLAACARVMESASPISRRLEWDEPVSIGSVAFRRQDDATSILGGELLFSDGSIVPIGEFPDGWEDNAEVRALFKAEPWAEQARHPYEPGTEVCFIPRTASWVSFTATKVRPGAHTSTIAEMAVFAYGNAPSSAGF